MTMPDHRSELEQVKCPGCGGVGSTPLIQDGEILSESSCDECNGTGWTAREKATTENENG